MTHSDSPSYPASTGDLVSAGTLRIDLGAVRRNYRRMKHEAAGVAVAGVVKVLNDPWQLAEWRAVAAQLGRRLPAAIQLDSGMSRLGFSPGQAQALMAAPGSLDGLEPTLVMSHLACADEPAHPANLAQLQAFRALSSLCPDARRSLANSAGTFLGPEFRFDLTRPGIALYGGAPLGDRPNPMEPVVTLHAPVVQLRDVPAGSGIGYGFARTAGAPMRLATIPVGYADGWPRCLGTAGAAFFGPIRLAFAGRVSMDSIILDAGAAPLLAPGDMVELLGPHQTLETVAAAAGTISYEILTSLGSRYARIYTQTGAAA